ncbi:MAG: arginine--tRNA ligase [Thermoflavifilum sp.]|nr:arginine--tRNA ligase [Thermoflavifilum sp.]
MSIVADIKHLVVQAVDELYDRMITEEEVIVNPTKPEFGGDYTVVAFSLTRYSQLSPEATAQQIGQYLLDNDDTFVHFEVIKGFLNLFIGETYWIEFLQEYYDDNTFGRHVKSRERVMVEYSSPNTNKPLHLGHLRNNFLGWSVAEILKASGYQVVKTCVVNDRGIHICKSMVAWMKFAHGATPESTGIKGDHFVGQYYVKFNEVYEQQISELMSAGKSREEAEEQAPIMQEARSLLQRWEQRDPEVWKIWQMMNSWVYAGFEQTYKRIGSDFDKIYYESETYLLGKKLVEEGLRKKIFYQKPDKSIWVDLRAEGLDEKLLIRSDGTSVYITQDLGLAQLKYEDFHPDRSIYVIGDEQNYHMQVLKLICQKLQIPRSEGIHHLSYGMVDLPSGKMKSREGTVVDADDLLDEMRATAEKYTRELGKVDDFSASELEQLFEMIGQAALKYYLLRVSPQKRMVFHPGESIDFQGHTGPFIQYTYARIRSIFRKAGIATAGDLPGINDPDEALLPQEKALIMALEQYPDRIQQAADELDPSVLALYLYEIARLFNSFYADLPIAKAESAEKRHLRLAISWLAAHVIRSGMQLLGMQVPEKM